MVTGKMLVGFWWWIRPEKNKENLKRELPISHVVETGTNGIRGLSLVLMMDDGVIFPL
jgi:hypothetical protein